MALTRYNLFHFTCEHGSEHGAAGGEEGAVCTDSCPPDEEFDVRHLLADNGIPELFAPRINWMANKFATVLILTRKVTMQEEGVFVKKISGMVNTRSIFASGVDISVILICFVWLRELFWSIEQITLMLLLIFSWT